MTQQKSQENMQQRTKGFYNSFVAALNLNPNTFQLVQGALPINFNTPDFYKLCDAVPPLTLVKLYTSNPVNNASGNYMNILDNYPAEDMLEQRAINNYENSSNWIGGNPGNNPKYLPDMNRIKIEVDKSSSINCDHHSALADSDVKNTWAKNCGKTEVFWGISDKNANIKAGLANNRDEIILNQYAMVPLDFGGWFTSDYLTSAYHNPDKWPEDWDNIFGVNGSWRRKVNGVLVVNGYSITTTSYANYSDEEYDKISNFSNSNKWPFYVKNKPVGISNDYIKNGDNSITVTTNCKPGNYQILGFNVFPIKDINV